MASAWLEKRQTPTGVKFRVVWREVILNGDGKARSGARQVGQFVTREDTARRALQAKREELESVSAGVRVKVHPKSWSEVAALYLDHSQKHKSHRTYRNFDKPNIEAFTAFIGNKLVSNITTEDVQAWESELAKKSKNTAGMSIRARKAQWIDRVPFFFIPQGEEVGRVLSARELQTLTGLPGELGRGVTILLYTGMRLGELFALTWEDIRGGEATIRTLKRKQGEGQRQRVVPIHRKALEALGSAGQGPIMAIPRAAFEKAFRNRIKALGWPRTRLHDLRHTWATRYMESTGDLYGLMRLGGWKDLKSVERYQHLTKGRSEAILGLDFGLVATPVPPDA